MTGISCVSRVQVIKRFSFERMTVRSIVKAARQLGAFHNFWLGQFRALAFCWSNAHTSALLAFKRCIENNRWADFLDWKACSGATV